MAHSGGWERASLRSPLSQTKDLDYRTEQLDPFCQDCLTQSPPSKSPIYMPFSPKKHLGSSHLLLEDLPLFPTC